MPTIIVQEVVYSVTVAAQAVSVTIGDALVSVSVSEPTTTVSVDGDDVTVVTADSPSTVVVTDPVATTVSIGGDNTATVSQPEVNVVTVAEQGPSAEDIAMQYRQLVDFVEDTPAANFTTIYKGWASPGAGDGSVAAWKVQQLVLNVEDDIISSGFAGTALFDQVWDNRLSLSYS